MTLVSQASRDVTLIRGAKLTSFGATVLSRMFGMKQHRIAHTFWGIRNEWAQLIEFRDFGEKQENTHRRDRIRQTGTPSYNDYRVNRRQDSYQTHFPNDPPSLSCTSPSLYESGKYRQSRESQKLNSKRFSHRKLVGYNSTIAAFTTVTAKPQQSMMMNM